MNLVGTAMLALLLAFQIQPLALREFFESSAAPLLMQKCSYELKIEANASSLKGLPKSGRLAQDDLRFACKVSSNGKLSSELSGRPTLKRGSNHVPVPVVMAVLAELQRRVAQAKRDRCSFVILPEAGSKSIGSAKKFAIAGFVEPAKPGDEFLFFVSRKGIVEK